jgi:hypothetical protein
MKTPIRAALRTGSTLASHVHDGLRALRREHRAMLSRELHPEFVDSLDLDEALRHGRENENRWDYLLGHGAEHTIVGVEPHSAKTDQISTVIRKREAALVHLRDHLKSGATVSHWLWVASGTVDFIPLDKAVLRLAEHGITFVGKAVLKKHMTVSTPSKRRTRR